MDILIVPDGIKIPPDFQKEGFRVCAHWEESHLQNPKISHPLLQIWWTAYEPIITPATRFDELTNLLLETPPGEPFHLEEFVGIQTRYREDHELLLLTPT